MKILFWNVREEVAGEKIREFYHNLQFHIPLLAEPKVKPRDNMVSKLGLKDLDNVIIHNGSANILANLWVIYRRGMSVTLISSSRQQVMVLTHLGLITVVHAYSVYSLHRSLWLHMKVNKGGHPWVTLGDFNCVLQYTDKKGGELPSANSME